MRRLKILAATVCMALLTACASLPSGGDRVVVFLKAKPGSEKALLDTTRTLMVEIRQVEGLRRVDINVQKDDPSWIVLYYHWRSTADDDAYRKTALFKRAIEGITPYLADRRLVATTNLD